jgi:hypothetical protein
MIERTLKHIPHHMASHLYPPESSPQPETPESFLRKVSVTSLPLLSVYLAIAAINAAGGLPSESGSSTALTARLSSSDDSQCYPSPYPIHIVLSAGRQTLVPHLPVRNTPTPPQTGRSNATTPAPPETPTLLRLHRPV